MALLTNWGLAIAYLGVVIGLGAQFHVLPPKLRVRYSAWFVASVVLIAVGTLFQMQMSSS